MMLPGCPEQRGTAKITTIIILTIKTSITITSIIITITITMTIIAIILITITSRRVGRVPFRRARSALGSSQRGV